MLTGAFAVLMGRWPPTPADLRDAERVCRGLGLGPLLDRMPGGIFQMVGETGWQLSHGERSRLFVARAVLQRPEVLILDESFAALDPETLRSTLEYLFAGDAALVAIAHP
ncbi:MAG: ATP-binding cassette domain-containing protein [Longimicrobiaceae bacterium]